MHLFSCIRHCAWLTSDAVVPPSLYVEREQVVSRPVRGLLWEQTTCDLLGEEGIVRLWGLVGQASDEAIDAPGRGVVEVDRTIERLAK